MENSIDINCDLGECNDQEGLDREIELLPLISSVNMSCGFHAGKMEFIERLIGLAVTSGLAVGVHPSYPDKSGFGRRPMQIVPSELKLLIQIQINKIGELLQPYGRSLSHIKPHGALYHAAMKGEDDAKSLIDAILDTDPTLPLMGQPGTALEEMANREGIRYIREGFADRAYSADGTLVPRSEKNAVFTDPEDAVIQTMLLVRNKKVRANGVSIPMKVDSICVHSDNENAYELLAAVNHALKEENIKIKFPY